MRTTACLKLTVHWTDVMNVRDPKLKVSVHEIDREHAKLSASGAHRWLHCTSSAWAEMGFGDVGSEFSEEGTRAHGMASDCLAGGYDTTEWRARQEEAALLRFYRAELDTLELLKESLGPAWGKMRFAADARYAGNESIGFEEWLDQFEEDYPAEMYEHVIDYIEYVHDRIAEARAINPDAIVLIEQRVDFSQWVPEGFGTADCIIMFDGIIWVIDYKHGKGVFVSVIDNEQTLLYGLGAWAMYHHLFEVKTIKLTIFQPRVNNISEWDVDVGQVIQWADQHVQPIANIVWHSMESGDLSAVEFDPSDVEMCRFCKAKVHCRARADWMLNLMAHYDKDAALMTDAEVAKVLPEAEHAVKWGNDLKSWAAAAAAKGKKVLGWKLVEGRANRKFTDTGAVVSILMMEGYPKEKMFKPPKLIGITDMTSLLKGKKNLEALIGEFIDKPRGKPVLVPESDPRPVFSESTKAADQGFE